MQPLARTPSGLLNLWAASVAALTAPPAGAAIITDVADAADIVMVAGKPTPDLIDVELFSTLEFTWESGRIVREPLDQAGLATVGCTAAEPRTCLPVDELRYNTGRQTLQLGTEVGLYKDLALRISLPVTLNETTRFQYASRVDPTNSSVDKQSSSPDETLFPNDFAYKRTGLGNLSLGLRYAPLNNDRDEALATWVLFFDWAMPYTAKTHNPEKETASLADPVSMGDGMHYLTFGTAFSKRGGTFRLAKLKETNRRGYTDPYLELSYRIPVPQSGRAPRPINRNRAFGESPSHVGRLKGGVEIIPYENLSAGRKVAIDLGINASFHTEGRNFSELSEALGEFTYTEQYARLGGRIGVYAQVLPFLRFRLGATAGYQTEHYLTFESQGVDGNNDGLVNNDPADEANPYFCGNSTGDLCDTKQASQTSYDLTGARFKDTQHLYYGVFSGIEVAF